MQQRGAVYDIVAQDAFFQPYLPLQQIDILKQTKSWLAGSTNSIVTQQQEVDLLVDVSTEPYILCCIRIENPLATWRTLMLQTENGTLEFRDPKLERSAGLTAADRKWMDEIVRDVNEGWNEKDPTSKSVLQYANQCCSLSIASK